MAAQLPDIQSMFQQIIAITQKSNAEISEIKQECAELRHANAQLERQVRDAFQYQLRPSLTAPPSPNLRYTKSPFLAPTAPPPLYVPPGPATPGNEQSNGFPFNSRQIEGFWAVVPAGGAGTRLWPLSREGHPKFLLDLTHSGRSLIQSTWHRLLPLTSPSRLMVVTGRVHAPGVQEQLPDLNPLNLLTEPSPKESAAAIGLAAAVLARRDPEAIMGSFAADHMIAGDEAFLSAVAEAVETARQGYLVTIGIAPSHPATGFGYIRLGESLKIPEAPNARKVSQFKEKPDGRTAAAYLSSGNYRWNAGMFVGKAKVLMELLEDNEPELYEGLTKIAAVWDDEVLREQTMNAIWPTLPKIAIDNAVAEPAAMVGKVAVVPATFGWDDVGDFSSLTDLLPSESNRPRVLGDSDLVVTEQVLGGIIVPASGRVVACLGVDDIVIVDTPDALLVTTRARSQEVKRLVGKCRENGLKRLL
ncbi:hypothetical protein BOTBODRAFT_39515 [Botryobasidium botryosum FD-172 SS1]|uniref:Uncharacterized protein n=1 Tax=Botryobasidium botryosum (strain FD-172 SS1) TaxID=930990 RepID=A0A067LTW3_BOTB1|nr:hypothetical protein BOTBODRAFT_39515 [Botryobasidium botryosum FD-172 SS1]